MANPTGTSQNPRQVRPFLDGGTGCAWLLRSVSCNPSADQRAAPSRVTTCNTHPASVRLRDLYLPHTCACDLQKPARQPLHVQPR